MRIAIVNDMALAREALKRVVLSVPGYTVAWTAEDGDSALVQAMIDRPDVILMDLVMPGVDGVAATRKIMSRCPCPILVVTSSVTGNFSKVFEAMNSGAFDAVNTPTLGSDGHLREVESLLAKLDKVGRSLKAATPAAAEPVRAPAGPPPIVAIGSSTGGPMALARILGELPADFPAAVLIAQHIDAVFTPDLVKSLQDHTRLKVRAATDGAVIEAGVVQLACTNDHMLMAPSRKLAYTREPVSYPYRPSVDVLFSSLAANWPKPGVAVLLTGMGSDGAKGLLQLKQAGWRTIAQDEASSVVYGMPQAAAELRAAGQILPLHEIAAGIRSSLPRS